METWWVNLSMSLFRSGATSDGKPMRALVVALALTFAVPAHSGVDARLAETARAIDAVLAESSTPGLIIAVTDRDRLRSLVVHGYADLKAHTPLKADSRLAIGSISKAFTSIALLQLADERRYDMAVPVTRYLPWLELHSRYAAMTGRVLMSHTSGLPNYLTDAASSRYAGIELKDFEPAYPPGAHWHYSNTGYQLLGYVLESIEGKPFKTIIQRRVLEPLGMNSSSAIIDDAGRARMAISYVRWPYDGAYVEAPWFEYTAGDGSIVSTAADMSAYARFILNRGMGPNGRVLSENSFRMLTTPGLEHYGLGLWNEQEDGHAVISHGGGIAGFRSYIEAHMDEGFALVFLSNGGIGTDLRKWVTEAVAAAFADRPPPAAFTPEPDRLMASLDDFAGSYGLASEPAGSRRTRLQFEVQGGRLVLKGAGDKPLQRIGVDAFRIAGDSEDTSAYIFTRANRKGDGAVVEVSHGAEWFVTRKFSGQAGSADRAFAPYVGHYVFPGPEGPDYRVYIRSGELVGVADWAEEQFVEKFTPLDTGTFRVGEEAYSPERAHFDSIVDGHAQRLVISGVPLYRRDTP